ncbi:MAG: hypothetical protein HQ559_14455 [Lentisphaerae bacterium]|nr:hypothetical protein [Lentisphaerota bacterium]
MLGKHREWADLLDYRRSTGVRWPPAAFLGRLYNRRAADRLLGMLLAEHPEKIPTCLTIEGEEHVKRLAAGRRGVIVLAGHRGPFGLQTLVFDHCFGVDLASYVGKWSEKVPRSRLKRDRLIMRMPKFLVGREKGLLKYLLNGGWVNILNDRHQGPDRLVNAELRGRRVAISEFPFKVSLKHGIPLLFVGMTKPETGNRLLLRIDPISDFADPSGGVRKYVGNLEQASCRDPYCV